MHRRIVTSSEGLPASQIRGVTRRAEARRHAMQYYQMWCNLIDSHRDLEFAKNANAWLTHLQKDGKLEGFRITRRKFGFGPEELGEFNITVWTRDMAQLDQAFSKVAARAGETEQLHRAVYPMVKDFRAGLYRDFPDPERA